MSERWQWAAGPREYVLMEGQRRLLSVPAGAVWNLTPMEQRLIEAAPELLAELKDMANDHPCCAPIALDLIARIEGKS